MKSIAYVLTLGLSLLLVSWAYAHCGPIKDPDAL